jgi:hypothetical protein
VRFRLPREYAYVLTGTVMAVPVFALSVLAIVFAVLSLLTIGLPFLAGALWLGRRSIGYFRAPARKLLGWDWPSPRPVTALRIVTDPAGWKALAYASSPSRSSSPPRTSAPRCSRSAPSSRRIRCGG